MMISAGSGDGGGRREPNQLQADKQITVISTRIFTHCAQSYCEAMSLSRGAHIDTSGAAESLQGNPKGARNAGRSPLSVAPGPDK